MGYANRPDLTERSIQVLLQNARQVNLLLINNGCNEPVRILGELNDGQMTYPSLKRFVALHLEENVGCLPMLRDALNVVDDDDLLVFMHNDVLIWGEHWDDVFRKAFEDVEGLGLAGLFGAPGVALDGGRMFARSRMEGREWGTEGELHGAIMEVNEVSPAAVLDSLCMVFDVKVLKEVGIPDEWPPHHWFDRLFCLRFVDHGYKVAVVGIPFDHYGGGSSGNTMDTFAIKWCKERFGTEFDAVTANNHLYSIGAHLFMEYGDRLALITDGWKYIWRAP